MNRSFGSHSWVVVFTFVFISLVFAFTSPAQKPSIGPFPVFDTALNPHDFTNEYYVNNGINPKGIIGRRNGTDGLSVFGKSSDPTHSNVRVTVTLPAYDQSGHMVFWYPLGDLAFAGFTENKVGILAQETAKLFPIYIFPGQKVEKSNYTFANNRQAPVIDDSWSMYMDKSLNPLGIRQVFFVNYTERAFSKECAAIMANLAKKNGFATDDTPIIKTVDDIQVLLKYEMISLGSRTLIGPRPTRDQFAIGPVIADPTKAVIAKDAFIWMAEKDGDSLPTEQVFEWHFGCLQATGDWCK